MFETFDPLSAGIGAIGGSLLTFGGITLFDQLFGDESEESDSIDVSDLFAGKGKKGNNQLLSLQLALIQENAKAEMQKKMLEFAIQHAPPQQATGFVISPAEYAVIMSSRNQAPSLPAPGQELILTPDEYKMVVQSRRQKKAIKAPVQKTA